MSKGPDAFAERSTASLEPPRGDVPIVKSRDLFAGRTEICIEHEGAIYRLKITRQGKLILNK